jgi:hypothetical protein
VMFVLFITDNFLFFMIYWCQNNGGALSYFQNVPLFYFILFYFILFYFILFYFILFYFILFYFIFCIFGKVDSRRSSEVVLNVIHNY